MTLSLYYSPGACSLAPHIVLNEIGVPFDLKRVAVAKGEHRSSAYLSVNPKGLVPTLEVNDITLTENPAILAFLGQKFPSVALYPIDDDHAKARCLEGLAWSSNTVHIAYAQILRPECFVFECQYHRYVRQKGHERFKRCLAEINTHLSIHWYSAGEHCSVLDPFWLVFYRWGLLKGYQMQRQFPAYTEYAVRLCQRPSVKQALKSENIAIEI
ncbi:MAG: glutathione S-transferase family protein [Saccharospirillum sp.]